MSIRVMTWVWDNSTASGNDRLVLLAIADNAGDDGGNAWPSLHTLARKTLLDVRTVRRALRRLEAGGHLFVGIAAGPRGANRYTVRMRRHALATDETSVDGDVENPVDGPSTPPGDSTGGHNARRHKTPESPDKLRTGDPGPDAARITSKTSKNGPREGDVRESNCAAPPLEPRAPRCLRHFHQPVNNCASCRSEHLGRN
ncbi:helix-turn-helix domain-containing protein [Dactylosporangium cerinum]|uniref:Helix-turn-helix domain-containing protein n=1 Tax=Dactylosporangium cerinum TaxID=1434730 RepID=A0ABV9WGB0_9ACTN